MPKRKFESSCDDKTKIKIEKLEKKLAKYRKRNSHSVVEEAQTQELEPEILTLDEQSITDQQDTADQGLDFEYETGTVQENVENQPPEELDEFFLSALGESSCNERQYGGNIHIEIFNTIKNILLEGLSKANKEQLLESLLIPGNCKLLDAPKLNSELLSVLNNSSKTRDKLLEERQQEMDHAIASICSITNTLAKKLSDISRILSNSHHQYTEIRKKLINPFLDKKLVESLKDNNRDEYLYSHLEESIKAYSAMKRATNTIKQSLTAGPTRSNPKNYHQPPRRPNQSQVVPGKGSFRGGLQQRFNPRPPFRPQGHQHAGPSMRGRAKYP